VCYESWQEWMNIVTYPCQNELYDIENIDMGESGGSTGICTIGLFIHIKTPKQIRDKRRDGVKNNTAH
jgi:hypothetical protein